MGDKSKSGGKGSSKNGSKESIDLKKASETLKAQKNQFAINRMVLMLMDIDAGNLSADNIDLLKQIYKILTDIHSHQVAKPVEEKLESILAS